VPGNAIEVGPRRCLGVDEIVEAGLGRYSVRPSPEALEAVRRARGIYLEEARRRPLYGYCTGLGALQGSRQPCGPRYEERVMAEHAAGMGPLAGEWVVRGFMAVWISQASSGGHPLRPELVVRVSKALEEGLVPLVPLYGSVGASGDLAPSAHALQCILLGRGKALFRGRIAECSEALSSIGLEPLDLEPGEALAAINNTAWSTALTAAAVWAGLRLVEASISVARYTLESIPFNPEEFGAGAEAKKHPGQARVARLLRGAKPAGSPGRLQDPYSIRCIPQVYGASLEALEWAASVVEREACSPTTNPVIQGGRAWHGCNFHTAYLALAAEAVKASLVQVANMVSYRLERLMDSRINGVSDFLAGEGSSVGAMIVQYSAAAIAAEARAEAFPRSAEWLATSLGHEDSNPMTPNAALSALRVAWILSWLLSAEAAVASMIRRARGLRDPLGVEASPEDPSGSVYRARERILPEELRVILDNTTLHL